MFSTSSVEMAKTGLRAGRPPYRFAQPAPAPVGTPPLHVSDSRKLRKSSRPREDVEGVLARVLGDDPNYARKVARVRRYQRRLRSRLSEPSWQLYLRVEEAEVGRWAYAWERLVAWALERRRRSR
jgi:hypothetical protein